MRCCDLFHCFHLVRPALAKLFQVLRFDELSQWQLPRLVLSIGILAKTLWAQPQFPCHLNVGIRETEFFSGVDPWMEFMWDALFLCHVVNRLQQVLSFDLLWKRLK